MVWSRPTPLLVRPYSPYSFIQPQTDRPNALHPPFFGGPKTLNSRQGRKARPLIMPAYTHTLLRTVAVHLGILWGGGVGSPSGPLGKWDIEHSPPGWKGKNRGQGKNSHDLKERESVQTRSDPVSEKGLLRRCKNPYLPLMDASISFPSTPSQGSHAIPFHLLKRDVSGIANTKFDELLFVLL